MSVQKQNDVIQDITEQSLLTLDGVAEEITKQTVQEEVDNFIAERTLKENSAEVIAIANKVKEYKKGDKTNFGVVVEVTPSSITFKAKDTPKTKIVFNQRKMGSKDYILSSLSKLNESMEDMRSLDDIEPMEAEDMENMEVEEEETIESLAAKLELTDEQVETLAAKSNEKYEEEGDAKLLDMLKMVAMPTDEEHKSAMMELIVNGDFDALEQHIDEVMKKDDEESEDESDMMEMDKDESEMKEAKRNFKKLTKDEFIKRIKKESVNENDDEDEDEEELSQEEEEAWKASDTLSDHFTYDSSEMPIKDFKYYAYKFVHIMDDGNRSLDTFKSMSDEKLVAEVEDMLGLGLEFDESPKYGARVIIDEQSEMKIDTTDIDELVSSEEGLTEGFKEKASIIFEAAVASKVKETKSLLKEQYATQLNEEVEVIKETLVEKIDSYLTYAVETWVNDNKVAVESTLRTEITESFIGSLKNIFTEHYIEVPESKVNVVADMEQQLSALKEQVATKGRIANALADRVEKLTRQKVIAEASAGLADTQIAKLTEMVEDVEFINEDTFTKKVSTIREFYVNRRAANDKNTLNENVDDNASFISKETIVENQIEGDTISPSMQNYLSAMSRMNKATTANLVS
jgi:hypothetical protein